MSQSRRETIDEAVDRVIARMYARPLPIRGVRPNFRGLPPAPTITTNESFSEAFEREARERRGGS